jgi:hypothetical protein
VKPPTLHAAVVALRDQANELANAIATDDLPKRELVEWARVWNDLRLIAKQLAPTSAEARAELAEAMFTPGKVGVA